jgi:hypothetical protein
MSCSEDLALEIIAKFTISVFSPFIAIAAVRDKNIKQRVAGVDPLQFNYKKM